MVGKTCIALQGTKWSEYK